MSKLHSLNKHTLILQLLKKALEISIRSSDSKLCRSTGYQAQISVILGRT